MASDFENRAGRAGSRPHVRRAFGKGAVVLFVAILGAGGLGACGEASSTPVSRACSTERVTLSQSGTVQAGSCSLDTNEAIDETAFGRGATVGGEVAARAIAAAAGTLSDGGHLRIELFGRDADREVVVYNGEIPPLGATDQFAREEQVEQARAAIQEVLVSTFDPAKQATNVHQQLAILNGNGSDIARGMGNAIRDVDSNDGLPSAAILITDGWENMPELNLQQLIVKQSVGSLAHRIAAIASFGGMPRVSLLAVEGLGHVPEQYQAQQGSDATDKLIAVYRKTCTLLHPSNCAITTN
jgi:type 1 fimbria pilin